MHELGLASGWYCVGFDDEIPARSVVRRRLGGRDLVVFRTASGEVAALDAHCPHLGADLSVGGTVEGETIRCPFHGFCFDKSGKCVSTPYGKKVPPAARSTAWPVLCRHGVVMVWFGASGEAPTFTIPQVPTEGWTRWRWHRFDLRGHPQEVAENSVDVGHLGVVHGYQNVRTLAPLEVDGPLLRARYAFERPRGLFGKSVLSARMDIHQWGLGYALVEVELETLGLKTRQLVLGAPTADGRMDLRIGMAIGPIASSATVHPLLFWVPPAWLARLVNARAIHGYVDDVNQDVPIWEAKAWTPRPALADGDGPIGAYRKWARQFYPAA